MIKEDLIHMWEVSELRCDLIYHHIQTIGLRWRISLHIEPQGDFKKYLSLILSSLFRWVSFLLRAKPYSFLRATGQVKKVRPYSLRWQIMI